MGYRLVRLLLMLMCLVLFAARTVSAATITVTLDTSSLVGGSYFLEFQLTDGDAVDNNLVVLSNFAFAGGNAVGTPTTVGGVGGDLSTSVTLDDVAFFNEFIQEFNPGTQLSFDLTYSTNAAGVTPDQFSFAVLNSALFEIADGPGGEFMHIDLKPSAIVKTFAASGAFGDPAVPAPTVSDVPEPATLLLTAWGLAACVAGRRRRSRTTR